MPPLDGNNGVTGSLLPPTVTDYRGHCQALLPAWDIIPDHRVNYETKHKLGPRIGIRTRDLRQCTPTCGAVVCVLAYLLIYFLTFVYLHNILVICSVQ